MCFFWFAEQSLDVSRQFKLSLIYLGVQACISLNLLTRIEKRTLADNFNNEAHKSKECEEKVLN